MTQNLIELELTTEAMAEVDAALAMLENRLSSLLGLDPQARRDLNKIGDKSEAFCREAVVAFAQNSEVLPRNFDVDAYVQDLAMLDLLRPRRIRLNRLHERMLDTETALGSDLMVNSLEGYAVLKVSGKGTGLDNLRRMLSARFARGPLSEAPDDTTDPE